MGYDDAFTANMAGIVRGQLRAPGGERTPILITGIADSICAPCPRRVGNGCEAQLQIDALDARHGSTLGIKPGDRLSWGDCLDRVRARVRPNDLDTLCKGCRWLEDGMCKAAVAALSGESENENAPPREERRSG